MGTTVNFPLSGTTTWDLETATWANADGYWGYAPPIAIAVSATITQVMLSNLNAEDMTMLPSGLLAMSNAVSAGATIAIPASVTFATTGGFTDTALALMPMSVTLAGNTTMTDTGLAEMPMTIAMGSNNTMTDSALALMPMSVTLATSKTLVAGANAIYVESITMANEQNMKFNINFEESVGFAMASNTTSINNFLWNDEAEDTGTTWTKV
jgi:hypothetical protein